MLTERIEGRWIDLFAGAFAQSGVRAGEPVAILSETLSRALNVELAALALARLDAAFFHVVVPSPRQSAPVPVRSTGASLAIGGNEAVVRALAATPMVVDLTVEGLMHSRELPAILRGGARVLYVSNEHPEILERLAPDPALGEKVRHGAAMLRSAKVMRVTSAAGTDLTVQLADARCAGVRGFVDGPRQIDHWPGGLIACFPPAGSVNGTVVMDVGDVNLTFKRYLERPVRVAIENDFVTRVDGEGVDADLMRRGFEVWEDRNACAISHLGWGMNPRARWESMAFYDRNDHNGSELRVFAGNFLWSTGANEFAGRHTPGHFDLPMRHCTITLDGTVVVDRGKLEAGLG